MTKGNCMQKLHSFMRIIPILLLILFALSQIVEGNELSGTVNVVSNQTAAVAPSGGGGGCGRNVNSNEDPTNIKQYESREAFVSMGKIVYTFTTLGVVKEIGFIAKTNEGCITARVEILKGRPSMATSDAPVTVYGYFNVWLGESGYGTSSKIGDAYAIFSVPDDWVKDNNIESVKLMQFENGEWKDLKTEKISADTYRAETMGFSGFAIVVSKAGPVATPMLGVTTTGTPGITGTKPAPPISLSLIIGVIIIIAFVVVIYIKRKGL